MDLSVYSSAIHLDEEFVLPAACSDEQSVELYAEELCAQLMQFDNALFCRQPDETFRGLLYRLLISRSAQPFPEGFLEKLDALFAREKNEKHFTAADSLSTVADQFAGGFRSKKTCALWKGDITLIDADAIVNAANSSLLGCFRPYHACIDNAIHAAAGPRLRSDCAEIIQLQGMAEQTGTAKITRGYFLPARFVLHTVGPVYEPGSDEKMNGLLASSYRSCLETAAQIPSIRSIVFCAVSTGVFGFPPEQAARIALHTVDTWLELHSARFDRVVFNVFSETDYGIYSRLLNSYNP